MPGTANRIADHKPLFQRAIVMRALRPDREQVISTADEQNGVATDVADELRPIGKLRERDALSEIGAVRFG